MSLYLLGYMSVCIFVRVTVACSVICLFGNCVCLSVCVVSVCLSECLSGCLVDCMLVSLIVYLLVHIIVEINIILSILNQPRQRVMLVDDLFY